MSLVLKSISSIILLAYTSTELLHAITSTLARAVYPSHLVDNIKDMLSKSELTKNSI